MIEHNVISVSGGKDSTAMLLLAIERQPENMTAVFADTGNEHEITYDYVRYLSEKVYPIQWVRADAAGGRQTFCGWVMTFWCALDLWTVRVRTP